MRNQYRECDSLNECSQKLIPVILKTAHVNSVKDAFFMKVMFRTCYLFFRSSFFEKLYLKFHFISVIFVFNNVIIDDDNYTIYIMNFYTYNKFDQESNCCWLSTGSIIMIDCGGFVFICLVFLINFLDCFFLFLPHLLFM